MNSRANSGLHVDARTGEFSAYLAVTTIVGNAGAGPTVDVGFRYSSRSDTWRQSLSYATERVGSKKIQLHLSDGRLVELEEGLNVQLPDLRVVNGGGEIRIYHKEGVTELLRARGESNRRERVRCYLVDKIMLATGESIYFEWKGFTGLCSIDLFIDMAELFGGEVDDNYFYLYRIEDSSGVLFEQQYEVLDEFPSGVFAFGELNAKNEIGFYLRGFDVRPAFLQGRSSFLGQFYMRIQREGLPEKNTDGQITFKMSGRLESISLDAEMRVVSHEVSFVDDLPKQLTCYAYQPAEDGSSITTTTTTQGSAVTTSIKHFDKRGQLYKELLSEDGVTVEILQGAYFVKPWNACIGYTKKAPVGAEANEQNVSFWVLDLDGNLICLFQNGIFTQRTYYKTYTMSVDAKNAVIVVDESLFAWFTAIIGLNRGTSYGIRYDTEGMKLPAAPPSATKRFNLPPIKEIGCPANPNFFNTYLESERVYKWSGGKLVDLSLTFYGYTRLAIKGDSPNLVKEMDAVLPSVKLTILAAECEDQAVFRKEAQTFNQGEIKALYGDWVDNGVNKFTTAQAIKGLSQSVSSTTMTGFVAAIVEPLEIKLKAWKDCSMTLETTEYYNDVKDQSHGRVKQTTFCILDKAGKEVPDSKQVTDFAYHMEQNKLTKTITFNDHDSSTRAQSQEITSINTGLVLGTIGSLKEQTEFAYDEQSRLIKETKTFPGTTAAENVTLETHYAYLELDNKGIAVDCTLPSGERQSSAYDAFGRPTASYLYSEAKQSWLPLVTIDYGPDGLTQTNIEYDYDAQDNELCRIESIRKIERTQEWDQQSLVLGNIVRYERYLHDTRQLRVWQTLDDQQTDATLTTYNTDGSIARVQTLAADESVLLETHFEYDLRGCLSKRTSTGQPDMMYEYDGFSPITRITCDGITTVNEYPANLLAETAVKAKVQAQGSDTSYELGGLTLDRLGRVKKSTIGGRSLDYSYSGSSRWGLHLLPAPNVKAPWVIEAGQTLSMTMISHHPYRVKGDF
ncbi:hypothetical protein [Pseudomonas putida]|uniref:hypothetical protein n=1 Tax=Pseudomonas putida TaxID=303 RepID=UPI000A46F05D|nr:hypothetical protein [Pseudomonas putida]